MILATLVMLYFNHKVLGLMQEPLAEMLCMVCGR